MKHLIASGTYIPGCGQLCLEVLLSLTLNLIPARLKDFQSYQDMMKDLLGV
jgi:hypothetical protein